MPQVGETGTVQIQRNGLTDPGKLVVGNVVMLFMAQGGKVLKKATAEGQKARVTCINTKLDRVDINFYLSANGGMQYDCSFPRKQNAGEVCYHLSGSYFLRLM